MTPPSAARSTATLLATAALLLGGCGSPTAAPGRQMAFPSPSGSVTAPPATSLPVPRVPPPRETVTGEGLVLQNGDRPPQLCLGPVAASWPMACDGLPLVGWSWATAPPHDESTFGGKVSRSGSYAVTGRFDGRALTVTGVVPLAPGGMSADPTPRPSAPPGLDAERWAAIDGGLAATPGLVMRGREGDGPILVTVVYDDGTIQAWADASFGAGTVVVTSALR
jgi:hypothetical protein